MIYKLMYYKGTVILLLSLAVTSLVQNQKHIYIMPAVKLHIRHGLCEGGELH